MYLVVVVVVVVAAAAAAAAAAVIDLFCQALLPRLPSVLVLRQVPLFCFFCVFSYKCSLSLWFFAVPGSTIEENAKHETSSMSVKINKNITMLRRKGGFVAQKKAPNQS